MSLTVLIVEGGEPITEALARTLARRGHRVATAGSAEKALELPVPDVFVCASQLPGAGGLDLLAAIQRRGDAARVVLLLGEPTVDECLHALRLGATELLAKPFRLSELVRAVEGRRHPPLPRPAEPPRTLEHGYPRSQESVVRCARDLAAFALSHGVPPSTRARIAGAAVEIVDNAVRHGQLPLHAAIHVQAEIDRRTFQLRIRDSGAGFDAALALAAGRPGPAQTGLARAAALSETIRVRTAPGAGTEVDLSFSTFGASLAGGLRDLSEVDFLFPGEVRGFVKTLLEGSTPDVDGISPAVAVVIGRLLAGPDPCADATARAGIGSPRS